MIPGKDCIGVGVGAMVFDDRGKVFLARRGPAARSEVDCWEFPGGSVSFGERIADAVRREFLEEYGMVITLEKLLGIFDHILPDEHQHWISATYVAHFSEGAPRILEPEKCSELGWFNLANLPSPLSIISRDNVLEYYRSTTQE